MICKVLDLDYTGHPLFDVGLATVVAYADGNKEHPRELEEADLEKAAAFIEEYYTQQPLTSFLTTSLMNSDFTQPAYEHNPERRRAYARLVARSFGDYVPKSQEVCVFTGKPALGHSLSLKRDKAGREELPPGRAFRQHIPLITGEGIINFSPGGDHGVPISGEALLCLQFFPMGCLKCAGRLLAIHSDNPDILLDAARAALEKNIKALSLVQTGEETKLPDVSSSAPALLIETIITFTERQERAQRMQRPYSVTAYHLTNSGQSSALDEKSPPLRIYQLPLQIIHFLRVAVHPDYRATWNRLVWRGWAMSRSAKKPQKASTEGGGNGEEGGNAERNRKRGRNLFYSDLFLLPDRGRAFVRRHFWLPRGILALLDGEKSQSKGTEKGGGTNYIAWKFIALFLQEVLFMEKARIEAIRTLGERLAQYVKETGDQGFLNDFYSQQRGDYFRNVLLRAARKAGNRNDTPLFRFDDFCTVFLSYDGEEALFDWKFARDLLFLRMLEWFYDNDDQAQNRMNALPAEQGENEEGG